MGGRKGQGKWQEEEYEADCITTARWCKEVSRCQAQVDMAVDGDRIENGNETIKQ